MNPTGGNILIKLQEIPRSHVLEIPTNIATEGIVERLGTGYMDSNPFQDIDVGDVIGFTGGAAQPLDWSPEWAGRGFAIVHIRDAIYKKPKNQY